MNNNSARKTHYDELSENQRRIYHDRIQYRKDKLFDSADGLRRLLEADGVDVVAIDMERLGTAIKDHCRLFLNVVRRDIPTTDQLVNNIVGAMFPHLGGL